MVPRILQLTILPDDVLLAVSGSSRHQQKMLSARSYQHGTQGDCVRPNPSNNHITSESGGPMTLYRQLFRAKGLYDGADTLNEIVIRLRATAEEITRMASDGVILADTVTDDYADFETEDAAIAAKYNFDRVEDEDA